MIKCRYLYILFFLASNLFSQSYNTEELINMSIEELMDIPLTIASKKELSNFDSPGIVTVVTKEEIMNSGSRDLIDILRLVPGFQIASDVESGISIGIRGNWGTEGKVLIMIDGMEQNELSYYTMNIGNRYDVNQIEKIEIMRGPGSAIYGGYAELSVINIITEKEKISDRLSVTSTYGRFDNKMSRKNISTQIGIQKDELGLKLNLFAQEANLSDNEFVGISGKSITNTAVYNQFNINAALKFDNFTSRIYYEKYDILQRDGFGTIIPFMDNNFGAIISSSEYTIEIDDNISIVPSFVYKKQEPWHRENPLSAHYGYYHNAAIERMNPKISFNYDITPKLNFISGIEYYKERYSSPVDTAFGVWKNPYSGIVRFSNYSLYAQLFSENEIVNLTVGARYENNDKYGDAFVPRIALTKRFEPFHIKLLASGAFRSPGIENYLRNKDIKPEKTTAYEVELGYQISSKMFFTVNGFHLTINDPIIYDTTPTGIGTYFNKDKTGSYGFETEFIYSDNWGRAKLNYSYYNSEDNEVRIYDLLDSDGNNIDEKQSIGFSPHKISAYISFNISNNLTLSSTIIYNTEKYGYDHNLVLKEYESILLANIFVRYQNILNSKISAGFGVYNILDSDDKYIQAYNGNHPPLPAPSREYFLKINYNL